MSRAAIRYAKAILDNASVKGNAEVVNNDMKLILETIQGNKELKTFINSPVVKQEMKRSALSQIFSAVNDETKSLFQLLASNARFELLDDIAIQYHNLYNDSIGIEKAYVTTAVAITPELESKVIAKASEFTSKKITIENLIDPSIIGGFILRVADKQYNASVSSRLAELKREFIIN
jgi:F-type H+-transporting ATPase subunit delta